VPEQVFQLFVGGRQAGRQAVLFATTFGLHEPTLTSTIHSSTRLWLLFRFPAAAKRDCCGVRTVLLVFVVVDRRFEFSRPLSWFGLVAVWLFVSQPPRRPNEFPLNCCCRRRRRRRRRFFLFLFVARLCHAVVVLRLFVSIDIVVVMVGVDHCHGCCLSVSIVVALLILILNSVSASYSCFDHHHQND